MAITKMTKTVINTVVDSYNKLKEAGNVSFNVVRQYKDWVTDVLEARIERIQTSEYEVISGQEEVDECKFILKTLENGWTISDIPMFMSVYELMSKLDEEGRDVVKQFIDNFETMTVETVDDRNAHILGLMNYLKLYRDQELVRNTINEIAKAGVIKPSYYEYKGDPVLSEEMKNNDAFTSQARVIKGQRFKIRRELLESAKFHQKLLDGDKQYFRNKKDYIVEEKSTEKLEEYNPNPSQKEWNIAKSNRNAIKEVMGEEVYDRIDEAYMGHENERRITIHHAKGNDALRRGEEVLEIDLAGSGYKETRREYHGLHGKDLNKAEKEEFTQKELEDSIENEFGKLVKKPNSNDYYNHVRVKTTEVKDASGKNKIKSRYTIAGPSPDTLVGFLNLGEYSIENTMSYTKNIATSYLEKLFEEWKKDPSKAHPINLNITGHSRGAVSAGKSVVLIDKWIKEYIKNNKGTEQFADFVKFNLILRDPVPGFLTSLRHGSVDLSQVKNLNTTVFCSVLQEHYDWIFPLQNVKGANKLIISTIDHSMDLASVDLSQKGIQEDGKAYRSGFYDAETGEFYRGSGLADLKDGVYLSDDKYNLIRITSISQLYGFIDAVHEGKSVQERRVKNIQKMATNWFLDNVLDISYHTEEERAELRSKADIAAEDLMGYKVTRLKEVQEELIRLDNLKYEGASKEQIIEQNKRLMRACRDYMKKTSLPANGDSAVRHGLVCDVMTAAQRENNYLTRGLDKDPVYEKNYQKDGFFDRQMEREEKRVEGINQVSDILNDLVSFSDEAYKKLKNTRIGKSTSNEYDSFMRSLKHTSKLNDNISIDNLEQILIKMGKNAAQYIKMHSGIAAPVTTEGQTRVEQAKKVVEIAVNNIKVIRNKAKFIPDKDESINSLRSKYNNRIDVLKRRKNSDEKLPTDAELIENRLEELSRIESEKYTRFRNKNPKLKANNPKLAKTRAEYINGIKQSIKGKAISNIDVVNKSIEDNSINKAAKEMIRVNADAKKTKPMVKGK